MKTKVKRKTTLPKIRKTKKVPGRLKGTERAARGSAKDVAGASQARNRSARQHGRDVENRESGLTANLSNLFVPVVDKNNKPMMPTTCSRAKRWIKNKKATGFWKKGIYCVRLNVNPSARNFQQIVIGIDPGSKKEGYTVKSKAHTYFNLQADAVTWVKEHMETKKSLKKTRLYRNSPYRKPRFYRNINKSFVAPSTKARWQWKLRICNWLMKFIPVTGFIVEDLKAESKKYQRKWNVSFSPLQEGKNWFYIQMRKLGNLHLKNGWETFEFRNTLGLKKLGNKKSKKFEAHCVDSWVLAHSIVGGNPVPDNKKMIYVRPLKFYRRQLHVQQPTKGGIRKRNGGTMSMGFKRGSLIIHPKFGLTIIGGTSVLKNNLRMTLRSIVNGNRVSRNVQPSEIKFLSYNSFLVSFQNFN